LKSKMTGKKREEEIRLFGWAESEKISKLNKLIGLGWF